MLVAEDGVIDVGSRIGPYEIISRLSGGGMAALFVGRQSGPGGFLRHVAIKVVHDYLSGDPQLARMFLDEARLSSRIDHPNVVHVEAFGEHEGQHYLVMELVDGVTLSELLSSHVKRGARLPIEIAVGIAAQVADALHAAHETTDERGQPLGIIHRDVSPQNILVSAKGRVKLIDFGIAKAAGKLAVSHPGSVRGKLGYMAPEQALGEPVGRHSDVFALGVVLWESLTLQRLFRAENDVATLALVREANVEPPSRHRPELTAELDAVVISALARHREERPATAMQLRRALLRTVTEALFIEPADLARLVNDIASAPLARRRGALATSSPERTDISNAPSSPVAHRDADVSQWSPRERPAEDLPSLARAELEARRAQDPVALAYALGRHAIALIYAGDVAHAAEKLREAETLVNAHAISLLPRLLAWRSQLVAAQGELGARLEATREAVRLLEEAGMPKRAAVAALNLADCYNQIGDYAHAEEGLRMVVARMQQLEMRSHEGYGRLNLAYARGMQGDIGAALEELDRAAEIGAERGDSRLRLYCSVYRAKMLALEGRHEDALATADSAAREAETLGVHGPAIAGWVICVSMRVELGDVAGAIAIAEHVYRSWKDGGALEEGEEEMFVALARAFEAAGDVERARALRLEGRARVLGVADNIADHLIRAAYLALPPRAALVAAM
jgi:serine/threonine protein kinase